VQRSTGHILAGNHRYRAVMAAEGYRIPVLWVDCDDRTAEKILLADNRTGELAHRDDEALAELLKELSAEDDLLGTGYQEEDLDALLKELALPEEFPEFTEETGDDVEMCECPECGHRFPK